MNSGRTVRRVRVAVLAVLLMVMHHIVALAQTPQQKGFEPMADIPKEVLPATPLVFGAYAFVWVALVVYVFLLWRRIGRVEQELADVNARLANRK